MWENLEKNIRSNIFGSEAEWSFVNDLFYLLLSDDFTGIMDSQGTLSDTGAGADFKSIMDFI